jgi:hypothetical protein
MPFESKMTEYNPYIHSSGDTLAKSANDAVHALKFTKLAVAYAAELAKGTLGGTGGNTPPAVSITAPANGSSYPQGTAVTFTGTASDTQDGSLSGSIVWTSSLSGSLGTGASVTATLSGGTHTITARVTDSGGLQSTSSITVTISVPGGGNLLANPGFESGAVSWTQTSGVINSTAGGARTGSWHAWLDGYGATHNDSLYQQVTIPAGSTAAQLCFYLRITTAETTTTTQYDKLQVQVRNSAGTVLSTLATFSNLSAAAHATYTQHCYNVGTYAGQTVRPYFLGTEDSSLQTGFQIDDTTLQ